MFIRNKLLLDSGRNIVKTIDNEYFLTDDLISVVTLPPELIKAIKAPIVQPVFKLYLLNHDESVREDITEDLILGSGNLDINYQSGQRRSFNISLVNYHGKWYPSPIRGLLWKGSKLRLDIGIVVKNDIYWQRSGVFTIENISMSDGDSNDILTMNLSDKFALIDGTLGGKTESTYTIPVGTKIRDAIQSLLYLDKGNGTAFDLKDIYFPKQYEEVVTAYTIKKSPNDSIGQIILDLAQMISCDVYYNETGNLVIESGVDNLALSYKPMLWHFTDTDSEYIQNPMNRNFSEIINKVIVVGANVNGMIFDAYAENKNPNSPINIYLTPDINFERIEDSNIYSQELAQDLADYTLHKKSVSDLSLSFVCTYMPHLNVNHTISITNSKYNFKREEFVLQSVSIPIDTNSVISTKITNIKELSL